MLSIDDLKRYKDIAWFVLKYGRKDLFTRFNASMEVTDFPIHDETSQADAKDLVKDLETMGPTFVKFGQIMSTQAQMLPPEFDEELLTLQDKVQPVSFPEIKAVIEKELQNELDTIFKVFEREPLSAASLGQVHRAVLPSGLIVAVKVQRPNIQSDINRDLRLFQSLAQFLENNTDFGRRYHLTEKHHNLEATLREELDYKKEAANLLILRRNLKDFHRLVIPKPIEQYTTSKVLTMEFISGTKITSLSPEVKIDIEAPQLADELFRAYLQQILIDGFFHMDPHPGNIYLTPEPTRLVIYDLGMVAHVPTKMREQLLKLLLAMNEGRGDETADVLMQMGKKLDDFDEYLFHNRVNELVSRITNFSQSEMPVGRMVLSLSRIAAESGLWLPSEYSMIGKTLLSLDQLGRALIPGFDPNKAIHDNAISLINRHWLQELTPLNLYYRIAETSRTAIQIPERLNTLLENFAREDYHIKMRFPDSATILSGLEKIANRITIGIILASLVIGASLLMQVSTPFTLFGYPGLAIVLFLLAAAGGATLILRILLKERKKK